MDLPAPILESWAARLGVAVLVGLSIWIGFNYWQDRHEDQLAWITVGVELIAFAGLACARAAWRTNWGWAIISIVLTVLAAAWCGFTMFEKISDDGRQRAIHAAEQTLAYTTASQDLTDASAALRLALAAPRPQDQGPLTIAAWDAAQGATVARLTHARDDAIVRVNASLPPSSFDWVAVVRGTGVEMIKLLGFAAFGMISGSSHRGRKWRMGAIFGTAALATSPAFAGQPPEIPANSELLLNTPVTYLPSKTKKSQAFAMRGRFRVDEIAEKVGVHQSTVYRWFSDRDKLAA